MKIFSAIALVLLMLAWGATGCLIIPTRHFDSGHARTNVVTHTSDQFMPGRTTREDVILALGEPDAVSSDEHQLAYRSEKVVALWLVVAAGGYNAEVASGTIYKNRFYVLEFDSQGRFQSVSETGEWGMVEGGDEALLNSPSLKSSYSNGVSPAIVGESIQREYSKCFWLAGMDGYRSKGATSIMGQPGHLFCTESNLAFVTASQFANTEPALTLPLSSVAEVRVDKFIFGRRLVVRLQSGEVHSFAILKPGIGFQDKRAMQAVCGFIKSRISASE